MRSEANQIFESSIDVIRAHQIQHKFQLSEFLCKNVQLCTESEANDLNTPESHCRSKHLSRRRSTLTTPTVYAQEKFNGHNAQRPLALTNAALQENAQLHAGKKTKATPSHLLYSSTHSESSSPAGIILRKSRNTASVPFSTTCHLGTRNLFPEHSKDRNRPFSPPFALLAAL
jgi:hypothetical protein